MNNKIVAFGPASVANVGPFYDVMGYCLDHIGDIVIAEKTMEHNKAILTKIIGPYAKDLEYEQVSNNDNCVQIVANEIWEEHAQQVKYGVNLVLFKGMPTQSGLGSSAASCVAAAKAMYNILSLEKTVTVREIAEKMISGEKASSDHYYPDNIVPSYWGGFYIISRYWRQKIDVENFYTIVVLNNKASTRLQRQTVDEYFQNIITSEESNDKKVEQILQYLRFQSSCAARVIYTLSKGDLASAGKCISESKYNFLEQSRKGSIVNYDLIKDTAIDAGALGCSISGSGPSVFAITNSYERALEIKDSIIEAINYRDTKWLISPINNDGARLIDDNYERWIEENKSNHNFWD